MFIAIVQIPEVFAQNTFEWCTVKLGPRSRLLCLNVVESCEEVYYFSSQRHLIIMNIIHHRGLGVVYSFFSQHLIMNITNLALPSRNFLL